MFKKAERKKAKLKIAMTGTSGAGKTYSSLLVARGIVGEKGKIALIDTENKSASLYAHVTEFDTAELTAPFTIEKYTDAINGAVKAGYDIVIIDSLSHAWKQLLAEKEQTDAKGGNSFTNWAKYTPKHEAFINALTHSDIHLIGTMRSKTEYVIEQNDRGKTAPRKVGLAPVQREGMEYEFTVVLDIASPSHLAEASKDRTSLFDGQLFKPTIDTGEKIKEWLEKGIDFIPEPVELPKGNVKKFIELLEKTTSEEELNNLIHKLPERKWESEELEMITEIEKIKRSNLK
jgi:hypothetical protein